MFETLKRHWLKVALFTLLFFPTAFFVLAFVGMSAALRGADKADH